MRRPSTDRIDGIVNLHTELQVELPQIQVKVDLAAAGRVGLKPGDIRRAAATILSGQEVSDMHRDGKVYDVMVWSAPETRHSLSSVRELLIDTPDGNHVRLGDVADVSIQPTPERHQARSFLAAHRRRRQRARTRSRLRGGRRGARLEEVKFPLEYYAQVLGEYAERQAAQKRMLAIAVVTVIGIFLLLQTAYESWRLALLTFLALPAALAGGVLATLVSGGNISLGTLVGFLTVMGIAARNGILLVHHYQHLEQQEGEPFGLGLVLRGARERLSPILMTSLCTGLALLPLVAFGNIPGHEVEHPMAVVILGGLVTSTLLSLFVMPSLYPSFGARREGAVQGSPLAVSGA